MKKLIIQAYHFPPEMSESYQLLIANKDEVWKSGNLSLAAREKLNMLYSDLTSVWNKNVTPTLKKSLDKKYQESIALKPDLVNCEQEYRNSLMMNLEEEEKKLAMNKTQLEKKETELTMSKIQLERGETALKEKQKSTKMLLKELRVEMAEELENCP